VPIYEFECEACGERFEVIQKFSDAPRETCAKCGKGPIRRLASSPAIQFKGSGWYVTDYAKKGSSDASKPASKDSAKTDTAAADSTKTESTPKPADTPKKESSS